MTAPHRVYLDNAATTFPKPEAVYAAMDNYNRWTGTAIGRGASCAAVKTSAVVQRCREQIAKLLGAESPEQLVFTYSGTDSLNLALHGLLHRGDHVITTAMEHNSVLRPLHELHGRLGVEVTTVTADARGWVDPAQIQLALRPTTRLVTLIHASNVTGAIQPVCDIGEISRRAGALLLLDAAQSAGHLPINLRDLPVDLLACPGHKGLLGPLGTGVLYFRPGIEQQVRSLRQGGTGTRSEDEFQPESLPDKYEAGNHNAPGLVGLEAAVSWLTERGVLPLQRHTEQLVAQLLSGLSGIPHVRLFGPDSPEERVGVISLNVAGFDPQTVSAILDQSFGIETRAGLHCAPGAHRAIGSFEGGGTVRLSIGPFTQTDDVAAVVSAIEQIASSA